MEENLPTREDGLSAPGYPELASLITTEMDYSIYRKFDWLSARILLRYQAELTPIEDDLRHNEHIMDVARKDSLLSQSEKLMRDYRTCIPLSPVSCSVS